MLNSDNPQVISFFHEPTSAASHLLIDPTTRQAAIIDPVLDFDAKSGRTSTAFADQLLARAAEERATVLYVLETHAHADHLSSAAYLREKLTARVGIGEHIRDVQKIFKPIFNATDLVPDGRAFDLLVADGDELVLGKTTIHVMHTPGHTPGCVTYLAGDAAFIGDTLFMPDYGTARADFPGGDAHTLYKSIQKILALPDNTRVFLCHDYLSSSRKRHQWETTVIDERANVHLVLNQTEEAFVAFRNARDRTLEAPALLLPSIQVNIRAGHFPPPADDGHVYLQLPIDRI